MMTPHGVNGGERVKLTNSSSSHPGHTHQGDMSRRTGLCGHVASVLVTAGREEAEGEQVGEGWGPQRGARDLPLGVKRLMECICHGGIVGECGGSKVIGDWRACVTDSGGDVGRGRCCPRVAAHLHTLDPLAHTEQTQKEVCHN